MTVLLSPDGLDFVVQRHLAILSTLGRSGGIHSVPVGFTFENGLVRIITSDETQKVRNVERAGHATVAQVEGARWLSLSGPARIDRDPAAVAHAVQLYAARYRQPGVNPRRVVIEIAADTLLGSSGVAAAPVS
ncbi:MULTISPECIES: pyridoxamine 5'-phosphate oxidase family protein [Subtercola]|uniref:PPOX class F420-dependent enzyme n=1 Tax=Subtercola vilae TaxID=2056433 RepID=A0A4T2CDI1_9MICO|nr:MULTISPECIES: pyridoxamine 5'-phosphate oxidase family protein [Subtercola]MEA9983793.1 pyridoxamine 5'-phosphate oxidase family protein [Subtercola sp. RTI3]TIH40666.1 PPOX class F420-dependent enzyme [Subtercola vilae]